MPSLKLLVKQYGIKPNQSGSRKLVTEEFRSSFAFVHEARAMNEGDEPKYSIQMIFDKSNDKAIKGIVQVLANAAAIKWGEDTSKWPKMKYNPMTVDTEMDEEGNLDMVEKHLHGKCTLNARNKNKPGLVGPDAKPLMDADDFYSGCFARASLGCFAYENSGNKGVSLSLNNLMKTKDGDRLDGHSKAEDDFSSFATEVPEAEADNASTEGF